MTKVRNYVSTTRALTFAQAEDIRRRFDGVHCTIRQLAREFGCADKTVRGVLTGRFYRRPLPSDRTAPEPETIPVPAPSCDPAVLTYRLEVAKRSERARPEMQAAKKAFGALLEQARAAGKGGRPKGSGKVKQSPHPKWEKVRLTIAPKDPANALLEAVPYYGPL